MMEHSPALTTSFIKKIPDVQHTLLHPEEVTFRASWYEIAAKSYQ